MKIDEIKRIPMSDILLSFNIPVISGMFTAIWRNDEKPSCKILNDGKTGAWIFYDHGTGDRGTNIDLIMKLKGCSLREAFLHLESFVDCFSRNSGFHEKDETRSEVDDSIYKINKLHSEKQRTTFSGFEIGSEVDDSSYKINKLQKTSWTVTEKEPLTSFTERIKKHRGFETEDCRNIFAVRIQKEHIKIRLCGHQNIAGGWNCFFPEHGKFKAVVSPDGLGWDKGTENRLIVAESIFDGIATRKLTGFHADIIYGRCPLARRMAIAISKRPLQYDEIIIAFDNDAAGNIAAENFTGTRLRMTEKDPSSEWIVKLSTGK